MSRLEISVIASAAGPQVAVVQLLELLAAIGWRTRGAADLRAMLLEARAHQSDEACTAALGIVLASVAGWAEASPPGTPLDRFRRALRDAMEADAGVTQGRADA